MLTIKQKQNTFVCLYLIRRAMQPPGQYRFFLIPPKVPTKNQATPKIRARKNPGIENFKPKKILRSSPSLEIPVTPPGLKTQWTSVKCCNLCGNYKPRWWKDAMYSRIFQYGLLIWADLGWRIPMGHSSKLKIGSLSTDVFEPRTSTGSRDFSSLMRISPFSFKKSSC